MAAPIKPALKRAFGNDSWTWVPAIADAYAPTVAEVTAATGFNLSCSLFGDQDGVTAHHREGDPAAASVRDRRPSRSNGATTNSAWPT